MRANSSFDDFEDLLQKFRHLPGNGKASAKTFLEISDFPQSELVCSNILAFFLDPNEEHGFGDLFLDSLLQNARLKPLPPRRAKNLYSAEIFREDPTDSKKRIDIVVKGDSFVIGIENKIDARCDNPFGEYRKHLEYLAKEKDLLCLLLTLTDQCPQNAKDARFESMSYRSLFHTVEKNLCSLPIHQNPRFRFFLEDFIRTIKQKYMDPQTLQFFIRNEKPAVALYLASEDLVQRLHDKVKTVGRFQKLPRAFSGPAFWPISKQAKERKPGQFYDAVVCDAVLPGDLQIKVEATVELEKGWTIYIWNPPRGLKMKRVTDWLTKNRMISKGSQDEDWTWEKFDFNESPETVAKSYHKLISNIAEHL